MGSKADMVVGSGRCDLCGGAMFGRGEDMYAAIADGEVEHLLATECRGEADFVSFNLTGALYGRHSEFSPPLPTGVHVARHFGRGCDEFCPEIYKHLALPRVPCTSTRHVVGEPAASIYAYVDR